MNIIAIEATDKKLISKIYKEDSYSPIQKTIKNWAKKQKAFLQKACRWLTTA